MASKYSTTVAVVAMLVCVMMVMAPQAESVSCDSVLKTLSPCRSSLKGGAVAPSCCQGMRSLNSAAKTTVARQGACECIKKLARSYKVSSQTAQSVINKCKVNIGYPISSNVDCSKVH